MNPDFISFYFSTTFRYLRRPPPRQPLSNAIKNYYDTIFVSHNLWLLLFIRFGGSLNLWFFGRFYVQSDLIFCYAYLNNKALMKLRSISSK